MDRLGRVLDQAALDAFVEQAKRVMTSNTLTLRPWPGRPTLSSGRGPSPRISFRHPAVVSNSTTSYFACHGLDGHLYYDLNSGSGFGAFHSAGGLLIDGVGIALTSTGATVYVEGTDSHLYHTVVSLDGSTASPYTADGGLLQFGAAAAGFTG